MQNNETANNISLVVYPEIYYRLQPFILSGCDQMDIYDQGVLSQDVVEHMSDSIYDNVIKTHPDLLEYANSYDDKIGGTQAIETARFGFLPFFGNNFGRRGLFRDMIDILLLNEIFNRTRRRY